MPWRKSGEIISHIQIPCHRISQFISIPLIKLLILKVKISMLRLDLFSNIPLINKLVILSKLRGSKMALRHIKERRMLISRHYPILSPLLIRLLAVLNRQASIMKMSWLVQLLINMIRKNSRILLMSGMTSKNKEI